MYSKKNVVEVTSIGSVAGSSDSPNYGFFIGPMGHVPTSVLNKRLLWKGKSVKNSDGAAGKIVEPPQGYVSEHIYDNDGNMVTEANLQEWFGADMKKKPSWNGGKLVQIEPKCLAFPYCNQGAVDNPIKLIGETKEHMCNECYDYVSYIGKETGKTPETIAKIIRERYLNL